MGINRWSGDVSDYRSLKESKEKQQITLSEVDAWNPEPYAKHEKPRRSRVMSIDWLCKKPAYIIPTHISVPVVATVITEIAATAHQTHTFPIFWAIALILFPHPYCFLTLSSAPHLLYVVPKGLRNPRVNMTWVKFKRLSTKNSSTILWHGFRDFI